MICLQDVWKEKRHVPRRNPRWDKKAVSQLEIQLALQIRIFSRRTGGSLLSTRHQKVGRGEQAAVPATGSDKQAAVGQISAGMLETCLRKRCSKHTPSPGRGIILLNTGKRLVCRIQAADAQNFSATQRATGKVLASSVERTCERPGTGSRIIEFSRSENLNFSAR